PGQPKDPADSALYSIYAAFASIGQRAAMQQAFADGIGWGDAKQQTFELIEAELAEARERYQELVSRPGQIEDILQAGASRARAFAGPFMARLRAAVGIQRLA
ncbi:MAG TPA: tryptophan--tRNA ligase, partial [Xanthomonadales bacterium]|nr:tryptophan--tRNA ligase [Xanthomonadales bacterium]